MILPSPELQKILTDLNATYRFVHTGQTYEVNPNDENKVRVVGHSNITCQIIDKTVNEPYFSASGTTEMHAMEAAIRGAVNAPKPLTPAQRLGEQARAQTLAIEENKKLSDRIAELEAQIAAKKK